MPNLLGLAQKLRQEPTPRGSAHPVTPFDAQRQQSEWITKSLKAAAEVLGLKLLDHLVISDSDHFSFHSNGEL